MGFGFFNIIFSVIFLIVIGVFAYAIIAGIVRWNKNNNSPRLTVDARIVSRRTDVTHHNHAGAGDPTGVHGFYTTTSTRYYVTFEVESGDRFELAVNGGEYGMLAEGDYGRLTFQGTRYISFERV